MIDKSKREYFSHDYTSRSDEKIKELISVHGMCGYGIYWALVEDLYLNANAMRITCDRIAHEMRCESEVIRSIIFEFKLFKITKDGKYFFSESVKKRLKLRDEKSLKASKSAYERWKNHDAIALQPHSDRNAKKERKGKERKVKEIRNTDDPKNPIILIEKKIPDPEIDGPALRHEVSGEVAPQIPQSKSDQTPSRRSTIEILKSQDLDLLAVQCETPRVKLMDELVYYGTTHARTAMSDGDILRGFRKYLIGKSNKKLGAEMEKREMQDAAIEQVSVAKMYVPTQ